MSVGGLALSTGCTSTNPSAEPEATVTVTEQLTTTATVTATPSGDSSAATSGEAVAALPTVMSLDRSGQLYFRTPSGNIECWLSRFDGSPSVTCIAAEKGYQDPVDFGCELDVVPAFILTDDGARYGSCQGDIIGVPGERVLAYGTAAENGSITCGSQETGVTCVDVETGDGFTVSREQYTIF